MTGLLKKYLLRFVVSKAFKICVLFDKVLLFSEVDFVEFIFSINSILYYINIMILHIFSRSFYSMTIST